MRPAAWTSSEVEDELNAYASNIANPYTLAAPPFENVSLSKSNLNN